MALHNEKKVKIRNQVTSLLSKSFNETEIAQQLGVCQGTISRDIKFLRLESEKFVFDLAKGGLALYFRKSINGAEEVNKECWQIFLDPNTSTRDY